MLDMLKGKRGPTWLKYSETNMNGLRLKHSPEHSRPRKACSEIQILCYISYHRNTEGDDKGMQIILQIVFAFALHAITIHESAVPFEVFKATVHSKEKWNPLPVEGNFFPKVEFNCWTNQKLTKRTMEKPFGINCQEHPIK